MMLLNALSQFPLRAHHPTRHVWRRQAARHNCSETADRAHLNIIVFPLHQKTIENTASMHNRDWTPIARTNRAVTKETSAELLASGGGEACSNPLWFNYVTPAEDVCVNNDVQATHFEIPIP